ncbi:MAG: hydroxymethylglutaryl-CoA lyase [Gammaproteobacteria bacterium]|nr:hydroxymethylglutaryl-CoA lyase [Gammaproteobacteria bacterium]
MREHVQIVEVAPRDGLQSQPTLLDTPTKLELIRRLVDAGIRRMEVVSFVNPKRVPQMADAEAVVAGLPRRQGVTYVGLVLNVRGVERAVAAGIDEINCVVVVTDTFGQRNQGQTTEQCLGTAKEIAAEGARAGIPVSVTLSAAFGCPFEGEVPPARVVDLAARLSVMGFNEISLADTIGAAGPSDVARLVRDVRRAAGAIPLRCHFHNTRNTGVANAYAALLEGVRVLDASCGGVGGCPFAPAATGNVATEDLLYMIQRMGFETGIDIGRVMETARWLEGPLGTPMPAMVTRAGVFPAKPNAVGT